MLYLIGLRTKEALLMRGIVYNIQKFCTKDGPGIRTTVFLKGCPLRCLWCHNPESQSGELENMKEPFETVGYEMGSDEVLREVLKDKAFFDNSGGGITISGGEPLYQSGFCLELIRKAKDQGLHVCMETCGYVGKQVLEKTIDFVDIYLYDYKETNAGKHKRFTKVDNRQILENLRYLDEAEKKIILRCPIIPGYNDGIEHLKGIANIANSLQNLMAVEIEPYHNFGIQKYKRLNRTYDLADVQMPEEETVAMWVSEIKKHTSAKVIKI